MARAYHRCGSPNSRGYGLNKRGKLRKLQCEQLEARRVLAAAISDVYWDSADEAAYDLNSADSVVHATEFDLFTLDVSNLDTLLADVPNEFEFGSERDGLPTISLPRPDGSVEEFIFAQTDVMSPELAAKFPTFETFVGQGIDDPSASVRFDVTARGLNAIVTSSNGDGYIIEPYFSAGDTNLYASYFLQGDFDLSEFQPESPALDWEDNSGFTGPEGEFNTSGDRQIGDEITVYRAAFASTGEYTQRFGGSVASGLARIVTEVNRVNAVLEVEMAVRFQLVANNDLIIYTDPNSDPYDNANNGAVINQNRTNLANVIGNANFDIGHAMGTAGGGLAYIGVVGINSHKAGAVSANVNHLSTTVHEIGHQFGSRHTFNGTGGACTGNWSGTHAAEPGSGTTILSYNGACGNNNIGGGRQLNYHAESWEVMRNHMENRIPNVGTRVNSGNNMPTIDAGRDYTIPARTPFVLTATASDADINDVLTYTFDQRDRGPQQDVNTPDNGQSPLFRFFAPTESPTRYFPQISDIVNNRQTRGETLPSTTRELNFSAIVRDNRIGAGGIARDNVKLNVIDSGVPFEVTNFDASANLTGFSVETITWNVAGTAAGAVNTPFVDVFFSTDGGETYPIEVATRLPNNGSADIIVPNVATTEGRFMVRGHNNVFFDINNVDLTVTITEVDLDLGSRTSTFIEDGPAVVVAPNAVVENPGNVDWTGLALTVEVENAVAGDLLTIDPRGAVNVSGNSVLYGGVQVASISGNQTRLQLVLNAQMGTQQLQDILRSVTFENTTDNPTSTVRNVSFVVGGSLRRVTTVDVVPTNDRPTLGPGSLGSIQEDTSTIEANRVGDLLSGNFADVDAGSFATGIAISSNVDDLSEGRWFYSTNGGNDWHAIGTILNREQSLVLNLDAMIGFLPAADYFGTPAGFSAYALDDTYAGGFSAGAARVALPLGALTQNGSASQNTASFSLEVLNVNDPPFPNVQGLSYAVTQEDIVSTVIPEATFGDIDNASLSWSLTGTNGRPLPAWMRFDPAMRRFWGVPKNRDVGTIHLVLTATDILGEQAQVPVQITVQNLNDPPTALSLSTREIPENLVGRPVGRVSAQDPDPNDTITWTLSDDRFRIIENELWLFEPLDYETEQNIRLVLTATDSGNPPLSSSLTTDLRVLNVNEFAPKVDPQNFEMRSGTAAGTLVVDVDATDNDLGDTITYQLIGEGADKFTIDSQTGEVRLAEELDFARQSRYRFFVETTDDGFPPKSSLAQFNLFVTPVNDFLPSIPSPQNFTISENSPGGTSVGTVVAEDLDGHGLTYELIGAVPFLIDSQTGELTTRPDAVIDFESQSDFQFLVRVTEAMEPNRSAVGTVGITVENQNEPPTGVQLATSGPVLSSRTGLDIGTLSVVDPDAGLTEFGFSTSDSRFEFDGNQLKLTDSGYFTEAEDGPQNLVIQVADLSDPSVAATFTVSFDVLAAPAWTNPVNRFDITGDGNVVPRDALIAISELNQNGARRLSDPRTVAEQSDLDWDVNSDGSLTPLDALMIINHLNEMQANGEGEGFGESGSGIWLDAFEDLEEERRRRFTR